jgi:hypothetical protein
MRKHLAAVFCLAAACMVAAPSASFAQRAPADVQKSYDAFIVDFRKALKANDAGAVAALTKFPAIIQTDSRDDNWLRKNYGKVFTAKVRDCIGRSKGVYARDGEGAHNFSIFCGDDIFLFTMTPAGFRFAEVGAND